MNILTFDIEDWFHLLDIECTATEAEWCNFKPRIHANVERLLETTLRHGHKATFFCLGWVAEHYPEIIRQIDELGFEVASHSHRHQLVYQQTPQQFREDLKRSIHVLEDITGKKIKTYRAPGFSFVRGNSWAAEALLEYGIERDSSIFPAERGHGGYENFGRAQPSVLDCAGGKLKEFPISLGRVLGKNIVFSGGGYFRLLPYWMIRSLTNRADYVMTYFHPRDFDADQPVLDLPLHRRFKSYVGLRGAHRKLDQWLSENKFIDIETADQLVDWDSAPLVEMRTLLT
ncbi:MAG: polysaccharide deacetylase family protein [Nitrosomonadales bacterium]|nr:polysaccharide deacetylase family protein [Nitrosomonadales bacterium]